MYASGFRFYFTPLPGFFWPFPHGTGSLSVDDEYLALEDGPPMFRQDFSCPALLFVRLVPAMYFRIRGYHPLWLNFPVHSPNALLITYRLLRVRSPLLAESRVISFPLGTEMVQFSRFASLILFIQIRIHIAVWVPPFGHHGIIALLPASPCFSQAYTSFFAYHRQGIHLMHLFT